jgi:hypothetical protein
MAEFELTEEERRQVLLNRAARDPSGANRLPQLSDFADPERPWGEFPPPNPPTVKRLPDPRDWVERQQRGATSVGPQNYLDGVRNPKKDPIQAGIDAQPAFVAAMRDPNVLERRVRGLQRTNINEWAVAAETKGANRYVDGVVASRPKLERGITEYHSFLSAHLATLDRMPNASPADRDRRVIENLHALRGFRDRGR